MSSVKQYIKNPKFGQGDEPEFLPVGTTGIDAVKNRLLQVERQALNITIRDKKNYASLTEAIAAVTDDKYKFKGFVLTFYTGTDWVSKRYNGEDSSGFADEGNWIDVGGVGSSTHTLDLSPLFDGKGNPVATVSEEFLEEVKKAYEEKYSNVLNFSLTPFILSASFGYSVGTYIITTNFPSMDGSTIGLTYATIGIDESTRAVQLILGELLFDLSGLGTKALTDNGQYAEFAKPVKIERRSGAGGSQVTKQLSPNIFYDFDEVVNLTITLEPRENGTLLDEYMFEFISGSTPTTLADIPNVKWQNGDKLVPEANCTYQVSIVNNCAVYAKFPNA